MANGKYHLLQIENSSTEYFFRETLLHTLQIRPADHRYPLHDLDISGQEDS